MDIEEEKEAEEEPEEDFDLTKFKPQKSCLFIFGFYRERVRHAWLNYLTAHESIGSLYLSVAVLLETLAVYIHKKVQYSEDYLNFKELDAEKYKTKPPLKSAMFSYSLRRRAETNKPKSLSRTERTVIRASKRTDLN